MAAEDGYTVSELDRLIDAAGETPRNDAKAAMAWDGAAHSAGLTKDILAMANSQDGGAVVLGKREVGGKFVLEGLTAEQADSFDTTKVAQFVNSRCGPPVVPIVYKHDRDGKTFVVIVVREFADVPVICTKDYPDPANPKKLLLRAGSIYVRTSNTASEPLRNPDDVRVLIGVATRKQGDQLIASFEAIIRGRSIVPAAPPVDQFVTERDLVEKALRDIHGNLMDKGGWTLSFRPDKYAGELWTDNESLRKAVDRNTVRTTHSFPPPSQFGQPTYQWGIDQSFNGIACAETRSGLFVCHQPYWEDWGNHPPDIAAHRWLGYRRNIWLLAEFFQFLSRFATEYAPGTELAFEVAASHLRGRFVTDRNAALVLSDSQPAVADSFFVQSTRPVEELRANWMGPATEMAHRFFDLFYGGQISTTAIGSWVEKFAKREVL
jgi:hypothetical protein